MSTPFDPSRLRFRLDEVPLNDVDDPAMRASHLRGTLLPSLSLAHAARAPIDIAVARPASGRRVGVLLGGPDELVDSSGGVREHWRPFIQR